MKILFQNWNLKSNKIKFLFLFDIRVEKKYKQKRIKNAISVETKEKFIKILPDIDKKDSIFIYCEIGKRTFECTKWLNSIGYTNVFLLKGGLNNWEKKGFPVDMSKIDK